jgi:hypothetical protein
LLSPSLNEIYADDKSVLVPKLELVAFPTTHLLTELLNDVQL